MKKTAKRLSFVLVLVMILQVLMIVPTFAAGPAQATSVEEAREATVKVMTYFRKQNDEVVAIMSETGYFIDSNYILTCHHGITLDAEDVEYFSAEDRLGEYFKNNYKNRLEIRVFYDRDAYVTAKVTDAFSEAYDFAVLKLNTPLSNITVLPLGDDEMVVPGQRIYCLGYPAETEWSEDNYNTAESVMVLDSVVAKKQEIGGTDHVIHKAELTEGISGGPTILEDGTVIGMNRIEISGLERDYFGSLAINSIKKILDKLSIPYVSAGAPVATEPTDTDPEPAVTTAAPVVTTPIVEDEECDHEWGEWEEDGDQEVRVCEICDEEETRDIEEEKSGLDPMIIIIIAVAVVVVIVIIIIIAVVAGGKKKPAAPVGMGNGPMMPPAGMAGMPPQAPRAPQPPHAPQAPQAPRPPMPPQNMGGFDDGAGNTTVLNEGAGETTVLGGAASSAALIRVKTGERIAITGSEFVIGKEKRRVNYCISDNNSISRAHAKIVVRGGACYAVDMNSTNFTYVNGAKLSSGQEQPLNNGDRLKLSDEEFEFKA